VGSGAVFAIGGTLTHWLEPVVGTHEQHHAMPAWITTIIVLAVVAIGILIAYRMYAQNTVPDTAPDTVSALTTAARHDLYGDTINEKLLMKPGTRLTTALTALNDNVIDGMVGGLATTVARTSDLLRLWQTGYVRYYALSMLAGAAVVIAAFVVVRVS
jgi:NADH-quinone oxidoreductase subunit L